MSTYVQNHPCSHHVYTSIKGYLYKVTFNATGQYYWGSRFKNITLNLKPQDDLWKNYFTSSKVILEMIKQNGKESFTAEIIETGHDIEKLFWSEQEFIKNSISDPLCLNKHYIRSSDKKKIFLCYGRTKEKHPLYGLPKEQNPNFGRKYTPEQKKNISKSHADVSGSRNPNAKRYKITSPDGDVIEVFGNLLSTCKRYNLGYLLLSRHLGKPVPELSRNAHHPISKNTVGWMLERV